jgi:hypothetical protein
MSTPRTAIDAAAIETKVMVRRLTSRDAMLKRKTDRTDRASSNCATVPRLPGEGKDVLVQNLSAYQRPPSGTCPSPQLYVLELQCN